MIYEESGRHVNVGLQHPLLRFERAHYFASSAVIPWG
jgi:hypothetical protein